MQTLYYLDGENDITRMELTIDQLNGFQGSGSFFKSLADAEELQSSNFYIGYEPNEEDQCFEMSNSDIIEEQFVPLTDFEMDEIPF